MFAAVITHYGETAITTRREEAQKNQARATLAKLQEGKVADARQIRLLEQKAERHEDRARSYATLVSEYENAVSELTDAYWELELNVSQLATVVKNIDRSANGLGSPGDGPKRLELVRSDIIELREFYPLIERNTNITTKGVKKAAEVELRLLNAERKFSETETPFQTSFNR